MRAAITIKACVLAAAVASSVAAFAGLPEDLREVARSIETSLPIKVDGEKHLESVAAIQDTIIFKYKVTNDSTFKDPRFDAAKYTSALLESQRSSACRDAGTLDLLRRGARFNYLMVGRDGRRLVDFDLTFEGCRSAR